jgi:phosphoglycolate phosphatase-like HAD superfamily hydrolase
MGHACLDRRSILVDHPPCGCCPVANIDQLRDVIRRHRDGKLPAHLAAPHGDPLRLLVDVAKLGDNDLTSRVADTRRDAEMLAVRTTAATPGADEVLRAASLTGRKVAVVSNNATAAIGDHLRSHGLTSAVEDIAARFDGIDPRLLKPHPFLLKRALDSVGVPRESTIFIGDSVTDIETRRPPHDRVRQQARQTPKTHRSRGRRRDRLNAGAGSRAARHGSQAKAKIGGP